MDIAFYLWLAGVGVGLLRLLAGVSRLAWIATHSKPISSERWAAILFSTSRSLRLRRRILLLQSDRVTMVGAWGVFHGRVLLPHNAADWPDERIRVVLAHELAHIKRNDWLVQIIAELARILYWFNPLFWFVCSRLRSESEYACDDAVLGFGVDGQVYAAHLLDWAHSLKGSNAAWSAVLAMAQPPHLERRFVAMLNPSLSHRPASGAAMLTVAIVAICLSLPLAVTRASAPTTQVVLPPPSRQVLAPPQLPVRAGLPSKPLARLLPAQAPSGSLSGTAYDPSGAVVPGVTVTVTNIQTKSVETVTSGPAGEFRFQTLQAGDYSFQAELPGFVTTRIARLTIPSNQNVKENVSLIVGNIFETVVVTAPGPPKPQTLFPAGTPRRIRVGGNVAALRLVNQVKPVYPSNAQNAGVEGIVRLQAIIGTDGTVQAVRVLSSIEDDLTDAALDAVRQWRYTPTLLNGVPVETLTNIDIEFKQPN
jgi:TonB family protein